jgi:hypothetical protein
MRYRVVGLGLLSLFIFFGGAAAQAPPIPPEEQPEGSEVLTRGPVHEAFAEPVQLQAEAGLVAPRQPPPSLEEYPPADRPQGDRYVWVPGYWSWDADRDDFIWVSACWRVAPPNMDWVPGYWTQVTAGWEWVPGFWTPAGSQAIDYLPTPPAPIDLDPPGPPPVVASVWVPGCWYWSQGRYVPRHGYWLQEHPGWVWVPSHHRWSPRGYVFVRGHWDYALEQRGVLFAPVYFPPAVYARVGFSFSPSIAIDIGLLMGNLFACPRYSHYYFGDYYDESYVRIGIYPQFEGEHIHSWYDPIYQYERCRHRGDDPHWEEHQRESYDRRRTEQDLRPPRTYHDQEIRAAKLPEPQRRGMELAGPVRTIVTRQPSPPKIERITNETRQNVSRNGAEVHRYRDQRIRWETPASGPHAAPSQPIPASAPGNRPATPGEGHPAVPPAGEPRGPGTAPEKQNGPAAKPRETGNFPGVAERTPPSAAPHEVRLTRPDRVKIPTSPVAGKPVAQGDKTRKAPPPTPTSERKYQGKQQQKGKEKEKGGQKEGQPR